MDLLDELQTRPVCGDGAMGTLLLEAGMQLGACLEELNVSAPDRVRAIHELYISAGARVVETNTFGANAVRLERFGFTGRVTEINRAAAAVARRAAKGKDVAVAGSIGPLGISSAEAKERGIERAECFREQITGLLDGGAELLFFETFTDFDEMALAFQVKQEIGDQLAICSFACGADGRLSSGITVADALQTLSAMGAKIVGLNCINGLHGMTELLEHLPGDYLLAAYPNAGVPEDREGRFVYETAPENFAQSVPEMVEHGARLIGGCCGTTPTHIRAIAAAVAELEPGKRSIASNH